MDLKICSEALTGLKRLGNSALINEDLFAKILEKGVTTLTHSPDELISASDLTSSKGDVIKEAYAALLILLVEAARCDTSPDQLGKVIVDLSWPASRSNSLLQLYEKKLSQIQATLAHVGIHPPHIVDVHWQLNHCVKSSVSEVSTNPMILVQLVTESGETGQQVKLSCTVSELQDFQAKLKEALRHIDRVGQISS